MRAQAPGNELRRRSSAKLFIAKVFPQSGPHAGRAADGDILTAVAWAVRNHCQVANMSLSAAVGPRMPDSAAFEVAAHNSRSRVVSC